ncbi:hypothetical protein [Streptomyces tsukubensis]|uniref:hypothetical protein n=1 Tax=Streptomyces tsukubensis TaxID=83656 RepID=UPI00344E323A
MRATRLVSGAVRLSLTRPGGYEVATISGTEFADLERQIRSEDEEKKALRQLLDTAEQKLADLECQISRLQRVRQERDSWKASAYSHAADLARECDKSARLQAERDALRATVHALTADGGSDV